MCSALPAQPAPGSLRLDRVIPLPGVEGRIDHLAADVKGQRVFVAALGNGTVEVVDVAQGKRTGQIKGLKEPQGVAYVPSNGAVYVAGGGDGTVRSFDSHTLKPLHDVSLGEDADNLRFDAAHNQLLAGYGSGAIAVLGLDLSKRANLRSSRASRVVSTGSGRTAPVRQPARQPQHRVHRPGHPDGERGLGPPQRHRQFRHGARRDHSPAVHSLPQAVAPAGDQLRHRRDHRLGRDHRRCRRCLCR